MRPGLIVVVLTGVVCLWTVGTVIWLARTGTKRIEAVADEDDYVAPVTPSPTPSLSESPTPPPAAASPSARPTRTPRQCHLAQAQAEGVADEEGRSCRREELVEATNCCPPWSSVHSCEGCDKGCCAQFHRCVSCCMGARQPFHKCSAACRTSSQSLNKHGKYADEHHRFCWKSLVPESEHPNPKKLANSPKPSVRWLKLSPV